jgi:hypothetical protein
MLMAQLKDEKELHVIVDYRLVGLVDEACTGVEKPSAPHKLDHWLSTTTGNLYLESSDAVLGARMRLQTWDGPADFDVAGWDRSDEIVMDLPTGVLGIDQITAGAHAEVFRLPAPGRWRIRVAWRDGVPTDENSLPDASVLLQFWPAEGP